VNRGAIAEINLSAIAHNLGVVRKITDNRPVIAVVKADAYGHGAVGVSKKLLQAGIPYLAVAYVSEAKMLRDEGITAPIIVLFDGDERDVFFDLALIPVVYSKETAASLSLEAMKRKAVKKIHVKIDTGMGRLGFHGDTVVEDIMAISGMPGIEIEGLLSHFSEADLSDRSYALLQLERFNAIQKTLSEKLGKKVFAHFANSAAVLTLRDAYFDAVRPGIMLYGYSPIGQKQHPPVPPLEEKGKAGINRMSLIPAMTIKSKLLCIRNIPAETPISYGRTFVTKRQSRVGVVPLGYADGYSRSFSNNAEMLVKGMRVPVVGRVCMDLTMVDLTEAGSVERNDEVVVLGRQGREAITAEELASRANTISYEILTSLGNRARRTYVETH
jgi:alanine racemase